MFSQIYLPCCTIPYVLSRRLSSTTLHFHREPYIVFHLYFRHCSLYPSCSAISKLCFCMAKTTCFAYIGGRASRTKLLPNFDTRSREDTQTQSLHSSRTVYDGFSKRHATLDINGRWVIDLKLDKHSNITTTVTVTPR